ncbi:MAG: hypothetical protein QMD77_01190 [Patescibacteria group bacterium]|nr:hypothetical protein [Patescibacteria group bacterium]
MKRISAITLLLILSLFFSDCQKPALGFEASTDGKNFSYYALYLFFDSKANTVALDEKSGPGGSAVDLTDYNLTKDTGAGSQFYVKIISSKNQPEIFSGKSDKFYLGKWELRRYWDGIGKDKKPTGGSEIIDKGSISVSVPYFSDGQKIEIYDAKTEKLSLSVDVSKFSKPEAVKPGGSATASNGLGTPSGASATPAGTVAVSQNQMTAVGSASSWEWLIVLIIFIVLIAGAAVLYWRYRKYKKTLESEKPGSDLKK